MRRKWHTGSNCYRRGQFLARQTGQRYGQIRCRPHGNAGNDDKLSCDKRRFRTPRNEGGSAFCALDAENRTAFHKRSGDRRNGKRQDTYSRLRNGEPLFHDRYNGGTERYRGRGGYMPVCQKRGRSLYRRPEKRPEREKV